MDSDRVYLDLGEISGAAAGQEFVIYVASTELKHPVTGESLGFVETPVARGNIEQVLPKYSIGRISPRSLSTTLPVAVGQRARLVAAPPAVPSPATASQAATPSENASRQPVWRSPAADLEAVDMAVADIDGDGKPEIVLADLTHVQAYSSGDSDWKIKCSFEDKNTGIRILSIDALDLNNNGKAEVFVTFNNTFFNRVETNVLECSGGNFIKVATLPWMTRAYQDASGDWRLAGEQLIDDATFPFGNIYPIEFKDGKYVQSSSALRLKRVDWIYGFAMAQDPTSKEPFHLLFTPTNYLRVQFKKGSWTSPDTYGQTSSRIRWHDKPLMFSPRLALVQSPAETALYTAKNIPIFGILAGSFGLYGNAELHKLRWTGLSFEEEWKADLGGYAPDISVVKSNPAQLEEVFVAVVGKNGKTSVWKFAP